MLVKNTVFGHRSAINILHRQGHHIVSRSGITVGVGLSNFETWVLCARLALRKGEKATSIMLFSFKVIRITEPIMDINKISSRIVTRLNGDLFSSII
jgi:hypothetical protein